ncbi:hypothetical protein [Chlamydiifrater phoenicopteri]|uniref:hypothetical protein n=1 Tax=Chlamydiifrater phoenicopteri TaxID=2681469 RepID=UPI001BCABCFE|nr:hypothetical protein [Chlamydiifrater phoenicopteri]
MTSPIGSPHLSPSLSSEPLTSSEEEQKSKLQKISSLLHDLLRFSAGGTSSSATQSGEEQLLSLYSLRSIETLSEQLLSLIQETSSSQSRVAEALLACEISLEEILQGNKSLSQEELSLIKTAIKTAQLPTKRQRPDERSESEEQKRLPLKKRKILWPLSSPQTPEIAEASPKAPEEALCSLEAVRLFVTGAHEQCSKVFCYQVCRKHKVDECVICQPPLVSSPEETETELMLKRQLAVLVEHSSIERVSQAIFSSKELLNSMLEKRYFRNHQLALLLEKSDMSDSICIPGIPNPKQHLILYTHMASLIQSGLNSTFIQSTLELWSASTKSLDRLETLDIISEDSKRQTLDLHSFADRIPKIVRTYISINKTGESSLSKREMSATFSLFLASVAFKTVQIIKESSNYKHLLQKTAHGDALPSFDLLIKICALILGSSLKWKARPLPCKASVRLLDHLEFDEETTKKINEALMLFIKNQKIKLKGSNEF